MFRKHKRRKIGAIKKSHPRRRKFREENSLKINVRRRLAD